MTIQSGILDSKPSEIPARRPVRWELIWYAATAVALAANLILFLSIRQLGESVDRQKESTATQIAKLSDLIARSDSASRQQMESVARQARDSATTAEEQAKADLRKSSASLAARIAQETEAQHQAQQQVQQQVAGQLDELKQATSTANSKLDQISGDVSGVRGDVRSAQSAIDQHGNELKRVTGDMGVLSGLIATNAKELAQLREMGDRSYVEFDLKKSGTAQKLGGIQLQLAKADPKKNQFTLSVVADDKRMEKKDRTVNEPVQLYVGGNRQPYEIVVNNVKKDEVTGYLAIPKVTMARR
jgi:chromosome segregation ATPase